MATKDVKRGSGRVTPKGPAGKGRATPPPSGRYTPPIPKEQKVSPRWVPVVMFTLLLLGMAIIVSNYLEILPGDAKNEYLFLGLGFITGGFIAATQYR
ncbi:MAG TPA: cell division protein CrgA [Acidimicrobiales bacterium]|nr:cell division protein CrgA [Acidimicrobiales bacterium]